MEREILFRGKRIDNGEWIEGDLLHDYWMGDNTFIPFSIRYKINGIYSFPITVIPETIGQFTGLTDKNGVNIFEGDICRIYFNVGRVSESIYLSLTDVEKNCGIHNFLVESPLFNTQSEFSGDAIEVIGNIHDNPELL